ncbi:hypothetical protein V3C33_21065 (plasmid) [Micrococcaceae bacterium Sec5.7]
MSILGEGWLTTDEAAELLGIQPQSFITQASAARKKQPKFDPDFPQPVVQKVTIYARKDIEDYMAARAARNPNRRGRPTKVATKAAEGEDKPAES